MRPLSTVWSVSRKTLLLIKVDSLNIYCSHYKNQNVMSSPTKESALEKYEFFYTKMSPFSQFYSCEFEVDGQKYLCAEQYMMHQKAVVFKDGKMAERILKATSPVQMKSYGRKVRNFDDKVWNELCIDIVKKGNRQKFSQNEDIKAILFATKGKTLVETSPRDRRWGIGLGKDNPLAWDKKTWRGKNLLGYALTEMRDELMKDEGLL